MKRETRIENAIKEHLKTLAIDYKDYNLCSNYGFTFEYREVKMDIRYWANCYGTAINEWKMDGYTFAENISLTDFEQVLEVYATHRKELEAKRQAKLEQL